MPADDLLPEVKDLKKLFPVRKANLRRVVAHTKAVDDLDLYIKEGEPLGLIGKSGCGKATTRRTVLSLIEQTSGEILFPSRKLAEVLSLPNSNIRNQQKTRLIQEIM